MPIDPSPSTEELDEIISELKDIESNLRQYIRSDEGKKDPAFASLVNADIDLNNTLADLQTASLKISGESAGSAVDSINSAITKLKAAAAKRAEITHDLKIITDVAEFGAAIVSGNAGKIISSGQTLLKSL